MMYRIIINTCQSYPPPEIPLPPPKPNTEETLAKNPPRKIRTPEEIDVAAFTVMLLTVSENFAKPRGSFNRKTSSRSLSSLESSEALVWNRNFLLTLSRRQKQFLHRINRYGVRLNKLLTENNTNNMTPTDELMTKYIAKLM